MEDSLLFRILFVAIYALFAGVRFYYRGKNIGRESEKQYEKMDKSFIVLSVAIIGYFILIPIYLLLPDLISWADLGLPSLLRWLGAGVALIAVGLTFLTHRTLGSQYSAKLEIQKDHTMISVGIYSRIRHPMYMSMNIFTLALSLMSSNLLIIIFSVLVALPFPWIARKEEALLIERFGDDYRMYMKRTGRFLPSLRKFQEQDPSAGRAS